MNEMLIKGGTSWADIDVRRGNGGLEIRVRTVPEVEQFMRSLGSGLTDPLELYGRTWTPIHEETPLSVYRIDNPIRQVGVYDIGNPSTTLTDQHGTMNLSFLRFAGVSVGEGVGFVVHGPYSRQAIKTLGGELVEATRTLVRNYVAPVHIRLRVTSGEPV